MGESSELLIARYAEVEGAPQVFLAVSIAAAAVAVAVADRIEREQA